MSAKFDRGRPHGGTKCRVGGQNRRLSTNNRLISKTVAELLVSFTRINDGDDECGVCARARQRRHSYRSSSSKRGSSQTAAATPSPRPAVDHDPRLPSQDGQSHRRLSRSRNLTMPARRRTSSSGRSPRPPSGDSRDRAPSLADPAAAETPEQNGGTVYRVRNFSTKSGSVVNRGDSIKVLRTRGEMTSQSLRARYGRHHFVGVR